MASRGGGPRPMGTDGNDFFHREKIAEHYRVSAQSKWYIKLLSYVHLFFCALMLFRLSASFFVFFDIRPPRLLQRVQFPAPVLWEYVWLASALAAIFALLAIRRNRRVLMRQSAVGHLIFGVLPLLWASYKLSGEFYDYTQTHQTVRRFLGYPVVVVWSLFALLALQLHVCILYHCRQLLSAWKPRQKKVD